MVREPDTERSIESLLRDLDAVRQRVDQAQNWLRDGETSVAAAALAEQAKHLCRQASVCDEPATLGALLAQTKRCLQDLERLLGLH